MRLAFLFWCLLLLGGCRSTTTQAPTWERGREAWPVLPARPGAGIGVALAMATEAGHPSCIRAWLSIEREPGRFRWVVTQSIGGPGVPPYIVAWTDMPEAITTIPIPTKCDKWEITPPYWLDVVTDFGEWHDVSNAPVNTLIRGQLLTPYGEEWTLPLAIGPVVSWAVNP